MKIKNVFITGEIKCGKSTLVNNILSKIDKKYSGYRTLPYYIDDVLQGFYIKGYIENENISTPISVKIQNYKMIPILDVFEIVGVDILKKSIKDLKSQIILLDEIGYLEREAHAFKKEIVNCLDSGKNVLGVLRKMNDEFFEYIKEREDTLVINIENIKYEDRALICKKVIDIFNE